MRRWLDETGTGLAGSGQAFINHLSVICQSFVSHLSMTRQSLINVSSIFSSLFFPIMITLTDVEKVYQHNKSSIKTYVLRRIELEIRAGEFVSIMGPSGSGKSTLLHILGMLDAPTSGTYSFLGNNVTSMGERQRGELHKQNIGFVFQNYHLLDDLTVAENIEAPLMYHGFKGAERKSMVAEMLDRFSMVAKKDLFPSQLSGGQQQLVGIARAVVTKPRLVLADEPTGNLNSKQGKEIMELFARLNREDGTTIVQVTHSEANAEYGNRVVELFDGWIERDQRNGAK
jgi:putative ABC transport system ATP-binding protein